MKGEKFQYEYQRLMADSKINLDDLPAELRQLVETIDRIVDRALDKCTDSHCKLVIEKYQPYADLVFDELLDHFADRIDGNELDEPETAKSDEEIIEDFKTAGRSWLKRDELLEAGFKQPLEGRYIKVGNYGLLKERLTDKWHIMENKLAYP